MISNKDKEFQAMVKFEAPIDVPSCLFQTNIMDSGCCARDGALGSVSESPAQMYEGGQCL